ncbi:MAG: DUF975 family protein [Spirochaetes bacterium]|nr:DUF975 family protein [Spirochaetota bacterium]
MTAQDNRLKARELLIGNYGLGFGVVFLGILIPSLCNSIPVLGTIASLILGGPLAYGMASVFIKLSRKEPVRFEEMFIGFNLFGKTLAAYLMMVLYVVLWSLLLIIPGIIAALGYSMTFYIMLENPDMPPAEALRKSKAMMMGHKGRLFSLYFSYIGWILLSFLTLGILFIWVLPRIYISGAIFYNELKARG